MVWVLLGPLAPDIAKALMLTLAQKGLMGFYAVTCGGFVGFATSLPIYFTDRFGLAA